MAVRRIIYLLTWIGCVIFFCAYRQWLAWYTLVAVSTLPVFSLLLSLPGMLTARLRTKLPGAVTMGTPVMLTLGCESEMPALPWRCRVVLERPLTGEKWILKKGQALPTEHCGTILVDFQKAKIYDYLGLFRLPLKTPGQWVLSVRPNPVSMESLPEAYLDLGWKPKPGGGFSENHELRLYRPGDNVQQIHWKLSGKTGKLILREPMEPARRQVLVRLELSGSPVTLDRKMGQLLWLGNQLLEKGIHFEIQCHTGTGRVCRPVTNHQALEQALDDLLNRPRAEGRAAGWSAVRGRQYYIGGGTDEA